MYTVADLSKQEFKPILTHGTMYREYLKLTYKVVQNAIKICQIISL
jgi:hypothetical protein